MRQTHCHVFFTRLGISSSNNKLYRLFYIRELNSHVNDCPVCNLIWAQITSVIIWCEHECPGWSFDVSTNVWPCQKSRGNECPYTELKSSTKGDLNTIACIVYPRFSAHPLPSFRPPSSQKIPSRNWQNNMKSLSIP